MSLAGKHNEDPSLVENFPPLLETDSPLAVLCHRTEGMVVMIVSRKCYKSRRSGGFRH